MLKLLDPHLLLKVITAAAFVRLCVETEVLKMQGVEIEVQPPSCGCVLKLLAEHEGLKLMQAAAFVRLCVETTGSCREI